MTAKEKFEKDFIKLAKKHKVVKYFGLFDFGEITVRAINGYNWLNLYTLLCQASNFAMQEIKKALTPNDTL